MKGKYKAVLALLLLIILVPLTLVMTLGLWVPKLAGIWLPVGTRIALDESPRLTRNGLHIPELKYLVGDCQLARVSQHSYRIPAAGCLILALWSSILPVWQSYPKPKPLPPRPVPSQSGSPCCPIPGSI